MESIACKTGNLLNGIFKLIGANPFMGLCRTYEYIVAMLFGLFLLCVKGKAVYGVVKDK